MSSSRTGSPNSRTIALFLTYGFHGGLPHGREVISCEIRVGFSTILACCSRSWEYYGVRPYGENSVVPHPFSVRFPARPAASRDMKTNLIVEADITIAAISPITPSKPPQTPVDSTIALILARIL